MKEEMKLSVVSLKRRHTRLCKRIRRGWIDRRPPFSLMEREQSQGLSVSGVMRNGEAVTG